MMGDRRVSVANPRFGDCTMMGGTSCRTSPMVDALFWRNASECLVDELHTAHTGPKVKCSEPGDQR